MKRAGCCVLPQVISFPMIILMYITDRAQRLAWCQSCALDDVRQECENRHQLRLDAHVNMVASTAHDLNTPLSAIQSGCRVLQSLSSSSDVSDQVLQVK